MSCGPDKELIRLMVQDALKKAVTDGDVQGGLSDCTGSQLKANTKVAACEDLAAEQKAREAADAALQVAVEKEQAAREAADTALQKAIDALPDTKPERMEVSPEGDLKLVLSDGMVLPTVSLRALLCAAVATTQYHATVQLPINADCVFKRVAWGYHPDDLRDPAATVSLADCDDNTVAWIYPERVHASDISIEVEGKTIGYAMASPTRTYNTFCEKENG